MFSDIILRIIEEFSDGFLILNPKKETIFFNDVLMRITGWKSRDLLERAAEFGGFLDLERCQGRECAVQIKDPEGNTRPCKISAFPISSDTGVFFLVRVRQDLKEEQDHNLRHSYELLFNNMGDALLTVDLKGRILAANPAFYRLIEYDQSSFSGDIVSLYVYKEELDDKLIRMLETDTVFNLETHLYTRSRTIRRVLDSSWVIRNERGIVTGYTVQFKDVTYMKNLESRLQISERNYSMLFDTYLSSIIIVDPFGKILNWNATAEQLYGYTWTDVVGQDFDELFHTDRKRAPLTKIFELVGQNEGRYVEAEVPRPCKGGGMKYTYASYTALNNSLGEVIAYSIMEKDLTERIKLEHKLKESFEQIKETQSAAILGFARLTEYRDKNTGKHLKRIREYTRVLATHLRKKEQYKDYITNDYIEDLCLSSVLHDVGKVGIEDSILLKTGKLGPEEYERIKDHSRIGGDALSDVDKEIRQMNFLTIGKEIAYFHHERWDGNGYPEGRKGEGIPLSARIVALADVYDALTSNRPYKEALSHEEAMDIISSERGTHFDPDIVDIFLEQQEVFRRIKMFHEFEENPQTIEDLLDGRSTTATA